MWLKPNARAATTPATSLALRLKPARKAISPAEAPMGTSASAAAIDDTRVTRPEASTGNHAVTRTNVIANVCQRS